MSALRLQAEEADGGVAGALLEECEARLDVVDAGQIAKLVVVGDRPPSDQIDDYPFTTWLWLTLLPGQMAPTRTIAAELRSVDADPERMRWVIPTHVHIDHVGGIVDLPDAPILLAAEEIAFARSRADARELHVVPAHARALEGRTTPIPFEDEPYEIFPRSFDVFGDGAIVIVPMPGHTPGSVGVFVNHGEHRVLHAGDVVHDDAGYLDRVAKPPIMRPTDHDPAAADRSVALLHALHETVPDLQILPAHSRPAWQELFESEEPRCIDWR